MVTAEIRTDTPQFANDLADMLRLFFGQIEIRVNEDFAAQYHVKTETTQTETEFLSRVTLIEADNSAFENAKTQKTADALLQKRLMKRSLKIALYKLLKRFTGIKPAWGSLTGIRPTRLLYEGMSEGMSAKESADRMAELYDVDEDKLSLLMEIAASQSLVPPPAENEVGIYIGIPFCVTRCSYCSFSGGEIGNGKKVEPYLSALFREMEGVRELVSEKGLKVRAVYIGGGTPTSLSATQLGRLMDKTTKMFDVSREFTVEAGRPDTINADKLAAMKSVGVMRISINPQTMNDSTLEVIGRKHTARDTISAFELSRKFGFDNINMDVIAGLPGENEVDFAHTLDEIRALSPESLTVHSLAIKHSSRMHLENHPLPKAEMVSKMVDMGRWAANEMGMKAYYLYRQKYMAGNMENVGYSAPGRACVYNIDMMEETGSVLGLGSGAMSKRVYPTGGRIERAPNLADILLYTASPDEMVERKRLLYAKL
ncbi:MAG: coproporphyrinogen dehydrogenase HemZ [Eubacteriales bacterium]|nr:coproporphyrinogen dehydrogenase HemZ [Eubacteriales bacterium]MDD3882421.1 coproporphyrinogen dehydrogenase HemZ [Eubacteriales bacterium]MDD4513802.1 coproporphyrinogen dehydrogenase HemZ [Eubacteriales bacterium]